MEKALSEKQIENQILSWLKKKEIFGFKVKSVGTYDPATKRFRSPSPWYRRGCPDILCCYQGGFIGIEVKAKRGALSEFQESFRDDILANGGHWTLARSVEDVAEFFKGLNQDELPALP